LLLPDGVAGDAAVHPEHPALAVDDGAGAEHTGLTAAQEATVVVVRDEADFLALGLVRRHQPEAPRVSAHLVLRQVADGKPRGGEWTDDGVIELPLDVEEVVGDPEGAGDVPCIVRRVRPTAAPEALRRLGGLRPRPDAQGDADNVPALLDE